jgi:hypothetical protein
MVRTFVVRILSNTAPEAVEQAAGEHADKGPEAERAA